MGDSVFLSKIGHRSTDEIVAEIHAYPELSTAMIIVIATVSTLTPDIQALRRNVYKPSSLRLAHFLPRINTDFPRY